MPKADKAVEGQQAHRAPKCQIQSLFSVKFLMIFHSEMFVEWLFVCFFSPTKVSAPSQSSLETFLSCLLSKSPGDSTVNITKTSHHHTVSYANQSEPSEVPAWPLLRALGGFQSRGQTSPEHGSGALKQIAAMGPDVIVFPPHSPRYLPLPDVTGPNQLAVWIHGSSAAAEQTHHHAVLWAQTLLWLWGSYFCGHNIWTRA